MNLKQKDCVTGLRWQIAKPATADTDHRSQDLSLMVEVVKDIDKNYSYERRKSKSRQKKQGKQIESLRSSRTRYDLAEQIK